MLLYSERFLFYTNITMKKTEKDTYYISEAIKQSQVSIDAGGYPCGAIIVRHDEIIATGISNGKNAYDATMHAEIDAIQKASQKLQSRSLEGCTLYTSMEPCIMCFSAAFWAYIPRIVYSCARSQVDTDYYMGEHDIVAMNQKNYRRKIELLHYSDSSQNALQIIYAWEKINSNEQTQCHLN